MILFVFENELFCTENCHLGVQFYSIWYLFVYDFEKWLTYPEWMMIGAASPNVIELTLVRSWSKVSIFMCRLASPHEVIWKWTNLRVSSFCEIIKQNLKSDTLYWMNWSNYWDIKQSCHCMYCNWVEPMKKKKKYIIALKNDNVGS